jgi:Flp pilus assembly protein TadD
VILLPLIPFIMQVGPMPTAPTISDLPPEIQDWRDMEAARAGQEAPRLPGRLESCLYKARQDPQKARDVAADWREIASAEEAAQAGHCLGFAESRLGNFADAQHAFTTALMSVPADERAYRARLGALAGNAALAAGKPAEAVPLLASARADALASADGALAGQIALDYARALVATGAQAEAELALAEARNATPDNPLAWLLSATLSRREGKLAQAQAQIEQAAKLDPGDPEIGLEAGVIAILDGREEAARKSWQSVAEMAPGSPAGEQALAYLAQLEGG